MHAQVKRQDEEIRDFKVLQANALTVGVDLNVFGEPDFASCLLCANEMVLHNDTAAKEARALALAATCALRADVRAVDPVHPGTFVRALCVPCGHARCCMPCMHLVPRIQVGMETRGVQVREQLKCPTCQQNIDSYAPFKVFL